MDKKPRNHSYEYMSIIAKNYDSLKNGLNRECLRSYKEPLDEDVFHDTILKCVIRKCEDELTEKELLNYVFISYKTNHLRAKSYAYRKYDSGREPLEDDKYCDETYDLDNEIVKADVQATFGYDVWCMFEDYMEGCPIATIERRYNQRGVYYKMNKVKRYLKDTYYKQNA